MRLYPNWRNTPEYLKFIRSSAGPLEQIEGHDWVNAFIGFISEHLEKSDLDAGYYGWCDVPWRRSAIALLLELYPDAGIENYLKDNPWRSLEELDENIHQVYRIDGYCTKEKVPNGIPYTHEW